MRVAAGLAFGIAVLFGPPAHAQYTDGVVKIGVLADMSSLYSQLSGDGSVAAAKLAVADFDPAAHGMKVEVVSADHHNNADLGANIARRWFDVEGVDMIADVPNSAVALAVSDVAREKNKVLLVSNASTSDLTGRKCSPNTIHWTYDTWMLADATGQAVVRTGGDTWFFLTADYAFGYALERDTTAVVVANGGKVVGSARHPLDTSNVAPLLSQARESKAKIIALADAGGDTENVIKQAAKSGITAGGQKLAGLEVVISDVMRLGLAVTQGIILTETWYWDMTEPNRVFTRRWQASQPGRFPNMSQAGVYSAVTHYLKAVASLKSDRDGRAVVAKMKELPTEDPLFGKGYIRADGRKIHPAYLFEVKKPQESRYPGDVYSLKATIPGDQAFRPMQDGGCPMVAK